SLMARPMSLLISTVVLVPLWLAPSALARDRARASAGGGDLVAAHLREARALRARSRAYLESAVAEYRAILQRAPHHLEAERGLARALRDQGAEVDALPYLRAVAERSSQG